MTHDHTSRPQPSPGTTIDVRRSDHDVDGFADRIAELITRPEPVIVQLGHADDNVNRIALTVHIPAREHQ